MKIKRRLITIGRSGNGDYVAEVHKYFHQLKNHPVRSKKIKELLKAISKELL